MRWSLVTSAVSVNPLLLSEADSECEPRWPAAQLLKRLLFFGDLSPCTLPIHHQTLRRRLPAVLSQRRRQDRPSASFRAGKERLLAARGAANWAGLRPAASGAGAEGGQRLLAATPEGRVVGALVPAVVVVRL